MSFPTSRDRRDKPEVNVAHVRPMVIKEPVSMATQWSLSTSGHLSRIENNVAPSLTATGLSPSFPFITPGDMSSYHQASMMNALPPFHLLPGNDVFHGGLATSYPHYASSLSREELLARDVIPPSASLLHSQAPFLLNNSVMHHIPFHPMAYPYGFVKDNSHLEPYRPLVLSKPYTPEKQGKLEKVPMSQTNDSLALHSHSPPTKRKCHRHEKIWDHKTPPDKKEASVSQINQAKQSHHRDSKCVLRVPEIKPQHPAFTHIKDHEGSSQPAGEVLDLSLKRRVFPYDGKDIPPDKKEIVPEQAMRTAPTKVSRKDSAGSRSSSAAWRMDSVIRMAPRLDKGRRDEGFNTDNCRISHAVPINNAAQKHTVHGNHFDKGNQQVLATNNSLATSKLDYENTDKRRRRKQNKPQYHKQENEPVTASDVTARPNNSHHGNMLPSHSLKTKPSNEHDELNHTSQAKEVNEGQGENKDRVKVSEAKNNEILRGDCHQVLLAQHVLNQVGQTDNVSSRENNGNATESSEPSETSVRLNESHKGQAPKKRNGPSKKKLKSFDIKEILGKSHNGFKQCVDGPKKRGRKPKDGQGQKRKRGKPSVESSDKSKVEEEAANCQPVNCPPSNCPPPNCPPPSCPPPNCQPPNCQPLMEVTNEKANESPKVNETSTGETCTQPPKRKRGRPRKSESLASSNRGESIGKAKATATEQKAPKGRRAGKKVQTPHKKVHTSRSKLRKPGEKNSGQTKSQGPLCLKRCAVLLCKLQMGGRQSIKLDEISSVSRCVVAEANKHIINSKSLALSLEQTKAWDGKESLDESFGSAGPDGLSGPGEEISREVRQDGLGPGRRKKRSCGYPYSPLLFAIGHCPLPHCIACKGHTAVAKNYVKRRRKTQACKLAGERLVEGISASGDPPKVAGCRENVNNDQSSSDVGPDGPVITPSPLNITCIKAIDQSDIKHPGYHPNSQGNDAQCNTLSNNLADTSNNGLSQPLINIPGSNHQSNTFQENNNDTTSPKISHNECFPEDDNISVASDQTELCEEEVVDVEEVESISPPLCEKAGKVEGSVDSWVQLENQCLENASLSAQQEWQAVLQETSAEQRSDCVKCDGGFVNKQESQYTEDSEYTKQQDSYDVKNCTPNSHDAREKRHGKVHSDHTENINSVCNMDVSQVQQKEDFRVQRENNRLLQDSHLVPQEEQTLKAENYDAQETTFLEEDRQIVAYKGIVTLDETENAEMYPSGVYVSSVV